MKSSTKQPKDETTSAVMYGDLMNGLCFTAFLPVYVFLWRTRFAEEVGPRNICIAFFWTTVFSWISYLKVSSVASALALISMEFAIAGMNIYEWPHVGEGELETIL